MKKKKRSILPAAILIGVLLTAALLFFLFFPRISFTEKHPTLERMNEYPAESFIAKANGTVSFEEDFLPTEEVGEKKFIYSVKKGPFTRKIGFSYEVKDTVGPAASFHKDPYEIDPGDELTEAELRENVLLDEEGSYILESAVDTEFSGIYPVRVKAEDIYGNTSESTFQVLVRDTEEPFVFRTGNGARILLGSDFDINSIISYGDNADAFPELKVEGEVDTSETGVYPLHATLTDSSGNVMEWDLNISVVEEIPKNEPSDYSYPFEEFLEDYAGEGRKYGIDVSEWQGDIDYEAVRDAGCDFVIMRLGWSFEGDLHVDKKFHQNLERAKEAGLPVGIYLFVYDYTEEDLILSMEKMFKELNGVKLDFPLIFDWENFGNYQDYQISFQGLNHLYDVFEEEAEKQGYEAMLYGSGFYLKNIWNHTDTRPVWLAQYSSWPNYAGPYEIWQLSDEGSIDGIDGPVDLNILFTD
ncbi:MAG: hypothetical protein IIZ33_07855 [Erysipelotrichaceae bacterium]|nr:hypothetical protein [Erysipelotrichaceae bacterium]